MNSLCPQCNFRLTDFSVSCDQCGWTLGGVSQDLAEEFEFVFQRVTRLVKQGDFATALRCLNRAMVGVSPSRQAECYSLRGYVHLKNSDFENAENDCTKAIECDLDDPQTFAWRAAARGEQGKWSMAFDDLHRASDLAGDDRKQYLDLMQSYSESASEYFRDKIKRGDESAELFFERGWIYFRAGKLAKAKRDFKQALSLEPSHARAALGLAEINVQRDDSSGIETLCGVAAEGDANCRKSALIIRAQYYHDQGNREATQRDIDGLIELAAGDPRSLIECYQLLRKTGSPIQAIAGIDALIESGCDLPIAYRVRGDSYRDVKNNAMAIKDYTRYLRNCPDDSETYCCRGTACLQVRDYSGAIRDFTRSLEISPYQADVHVLRGQAYQKSGQAILALEDFEYALTRNYQSANAYSGRAAVLLDQGRFEYTLIWLTKAIHRFSKPGELAEVLFARANAFYQMGRRLPAISDYTSVIDLIRTNKNRVAIARYARAICHSESGHTEQALKDFRRLAKLDPKNEKVNSAIAWLSGQQPEQPDFLSQNHPTKRPTRPLVVRPNVRLSESLDQWDIESPFDTWVIRDQNKKEFGPVQYDVLKNWIREGRVEAGMKVLRADWSKWKRAERIFVEISPVEQEPVSAEEFPMIRLK